jgi:choline dehydrogenase-like flavoprotein
MVRDIDPQKATLTYRLQETILVVELGYFADESCIWMPLNTVSGPNSACAKHRFNISSAPQHEINDLVYRYSVGSCVGGSSAVNGMVFDRGAKADYDAWEELGNHGWGWSGLFPYFKKSATFTPPSSEDSKKFGYTWDERAYGTGPIQASFPPFQWTALSMCCESYQSPFQ